MNFNKDNYQEMNSRTVPSWIRVNVASVLAKTGQEWVDWFSKYNSATHSGQWVVIDKSKIKESSGLVLFLEQAFSMVKVTDVTNQLLEHNASSKVIAYAKISYDLAREMKNLQFEKEALSVLMELGQNEYGRLYYNTMEEYLELNNSLKNTFAEAKYSVDREKEKTRKEREERVKAQAKAQWNEQFYGSLVVFSIISLLLVVLYLRARYKKNTLQKQFETEQRISKKLHDEVANDVFHIMSKLQSNKVDQDDLADTLEDIYDKTRDLSNANSDVDVSEDFVLLLNDLLHSYKNVNVNIFTRNISLIDWEHISSDKKRVLYRILQELMTNMKKHSDASLVTLIFHQENKKININYTDNGVGCDVYKGNGLRNAENRIELIGGKITFESEPGNGFKAKIRI